MQSPQPPRIPIKSGAKVFVLSCIDPRFTFYLNWFLTYQKNLANYYDQFTLAGGSLGVNQATFGSPNYANWHTVMLDNLKLGIQLHGITDFWVFDHLECGAYNAFLSDDSIEQHFTQITNLKTFLKDVGNTEEVQSLKFKGFIIDLNGQITEVVDQSDAGGIPVDLNFSTTNYNNFWKYSAIVLGSIVIYNFLNIKKIKL
jgi:hypothetical protein